MTRDEKRDAGEGPDLEGRPLARRKVERFGRGERAADAPAGGRLRRIGAADAAAPADAEPADRSAPRHEDAGARMVDVAGKPVVPRSATAEGFLHLSPGTLKALREGTVKKGDPFPVARTAAILAVKRTPDLIPLCHPIPITGVDADLTLTGTGVTATVTVRADYRTGVEMEALTAVTVALLTVWDMTKYLEKDEDGQYPHARISDVRVVEKRKGDAR